MNKYQALHSFWSSFGLKAYDETSVPNTAELPYITYETAIDDFGTNLGLTASVWYRSTSWNEITNKVAEIETALKRGGKQIRYDDGCMWIVKGVPFAQRMADSNSDTVRRYVINIQAEYID